MAKQTGSPQFWRCMVQVRKMAAGTLTEPELERLADELIAKARTLRAERYGMTADEAVNKVLKEMSEKAVSDAQFQKRSQYLNLKALTQNLDKVRSVWSDNPVQGAVARLVGDNTARRGARLSIDASQKGLAREWNQGYHADLERTGKKDMWARGDLDLEAYKALGEEYKDNPSYEGIDRDGRELGKIIYKFQELFRVSAMNAGAVIKKIPDYITHQTHDMFLVRTAAGVLEGTRGRLRETFRYDDDRNFAAWRDFIMPKLDQVKTFEGLENPMEWLRKVWLAIASGDHTSTKAATGFVAPSSLAGKLSEPRLLHFKDATARFEYDQKFARAGSLVERVSDALWNGAHAVALMREMGPNPEYNFVRFKEGVKLMAEQSVSGRMATKWHADSRQLDQMWAQLNGEANTPGVDPVATALRTARAGQTVSKLGMAVVSSITDFAIAHSELRYQGFGMFEAWKTQFDAALQGYGKRGHQHADRLQQASELGVAVDYLRSAQWSRFSAEDALPGWQARMQHLFFTINGLMWHTDTARMANAQAMAHRLAMNATRSMTELDSSLSRMFKIFDITSDEWDLMRGRAIGVVEGKEYFTPKGADQLTDVEIAQLLKNEGTASSKRRIAERRDEINTKFRSFFADRSDYAMIVPGPRTQNIMTGAKFGAVPGSLYSELSRSFMQFKGFPLAVIEKVYGREFFGYGETGKKADITRSGMQGLANFMVYSTLLGFTAIYLKAYLSGRRLDQPKDPGEAAALFVASFAQGGGAGLYGDFLFGQARDRYGHSALSAMMGPSFGMAEDAFSGVKGAIKSPFDVMFDKAKTGDKNAAAAFFAIKNNTPLINLFYTRMALDYLMMYRIQEYMAPGSLKRSEKNFKDNQHQSFKLPPSSNSRIEDMTPEKLGTLLNPL